VDDAGTGTCVVIGAGPAGLTAAHELARLDVPTVVLERDAGVGGIARTVEYHGARFDIGGHRFFTKVPWVQAWWEQRLGADFLRRPRRSRILYRGRLFDYPLRPVNALFGLGPAEAVRIAASYLRARLTPAGEERSFEDWVSRRFGRRMYEIFFKTYTEKVWGMPCSEIGADWAAQRIRNLDLVTAVREALLPGRRGDVVSLIEEFHYPRLGPGMMWERTRDELEQAGVPVRTGAGVERVLHHGGSIVAVEVRDGAGETERIEGAHFLSSMPLRDLVRALSPAPPPAVAAAAERLRYRDFLTVGLIVERAELFPDNWIYVHAPEVKVGRIQNFGRWSPEMTPGPGKGVVGLEYFVQEGDALWSLPDPELVALATRECSQLGLVRAEEISDGVVIRVPKAYPVYDAAYREALAEVREYLGGFANLQPIGRNGQHRYNNQDHSMVTGAHAARNVAGATLPVWDVNVDDAYHEAGDRAVPRPAPPPGLVALLQQAFGRYDPVALGAAVAVVAGVGLFAAAATLLLRGGDVVGPNLSLLGHYLPGFGMSWPRVALGAVEAAGLGFALGWAFARVQNGLVRLQLRGLRRRLERLETVRATGGEIP
jgi:protoporphyrinogen oxidase